MFRKIILFLIFSMCVFTPLSFSDDIKTIVVISDKCYTFMKYIDFDSHLISCFQNQQLIKIKKLYLSCHTDCNEGEFKARFDIVWKKVLFEDADFLIVFGDSIWDTFRSEIIDFSKNHKVGLFDMYTDIHDNEEFKILKSEGINLFVEEYSIDVLPMINYFYSNGKDFQHFYILRDSCKYNLEIANAIKTELKRIDLNLQIDVEEILSLHHLKTFIANIQNLKQGVIVVVMENLDDNKYQYAGIHEILKTINDNNFKHIEVSLTRDASEYLALSFTHSGNDGVENPLDAFLNEYDGDDLELFFDQSYSIMNEKELHKLHNGDQLFKRTTNHIDSFR